MKPMTSDRSGNATVFLVLLLPCVWLQAADYLQPASGDYVLRQFRFASGEQLPELRIHYRSLGNSQTNARGVVTNAVLILHGTTGSGNQFVRPDFAGQLFGPGGLLDAQRYYLV